MPKKRHGRNGELLGPDEFYDRVNDRYRVRVPSTGKLVHGKHLKEAHRKARQVGRGVAKLHDAIRLDAFTDRWADLQRENDRRAWKHSKSLIVNHVLDDIGHMQVRDISRRHLREWLQGLNAWMKREGRAPKTVHDVHRALSSLLEMAVADEIIDVNPAKNRHVRELLPPLDPNAGGEAYTADEVWAFTTDPRVPFDRRILHAGQAFAGMRIGESAGRRRSNINWSAPVLPRMLIDTQYQDAPLKSARGANKKPRVAPVHPAYRRMLSEWFDGGYKSIFGVEMPDDGFLVPSRLDTLRARSRRQALAAHERDAKRLGIEHKGTHAFRRHFSTFTVKDGAREEVIERITHNPKGTIIRTYIDDQHLWGQLCEAVLCLKVDLSRGKVLNIGGRRGL